MRLLEGTRAHRVIAWFGVRQRSSCNPDRGGNTGSLGHMLEGATHLPVGNTADGNRCHFVTGGACAGVEQSKEFSDDTRPLVAVVALDGMRDAGLEVILQQDRRDTPDRALNRLQLLDDIDAVRIVLDHAYDTPKVTVDALQAVQDMGPAVRCSHDVLSFSPLRASALDGERLQGKRTTTPTPLGEG